RRTAPEEDHVIPRLAQFANGQIVDAPQEMRPVLNEPAERRLGELTNGYGADRIGGKTVPALDVHPEEVAGQREPHDLPPPVWQQLVQPHDAFENIAEERRDVLLGEHGLARSKADTASEMFKLPELGRIERRAHAEIPYRAILAEMPVWLDRNQ